MGLSTWKQAPEGKVYKTDATVAKNYFNETELKQLQLAVTAFLDIAEGRATRGLPTTMARWLSVMDEYLNLNEYPKLQGAGKVPKQRADDKAIAEYTAFRIRQDKEFLGDFEKLAEHMQQEQG